jgi:uncharacterized protein YbgA (DUF1722 family)/uncharacterized protein YbbK (DUF523 family)
MEHLRAAMLLHSADEPIRIGVSGCLLGAEVRFDGADKRNAFLVDTLGKLVEFVPVCPEVEIGLGVPRETLRLVRDDDSPWMIRLASESGIDHTERMNSYAALRLDAVEREGLSGYVLKKNSPSCGMEGVPFYTGRGDTAGHGSGLFAAALRKRFPLLPIEEEERLENPQLRENFIERIFAYRRLRAFFSTQWTLEGLVQFHTSHELVLMAHSPNSYEKIGGLVTNPRYKDRGKLQERYQIAFMEALKQLANAAGHVNVLHHTLGYLRPHLTPDARNELRTVINNYQHGLLPLIVPIALVRDYVRKFSIAYLCRQVYLEPDPKELILRNLA